MLNKNKEQGFTIVEIMIVLAVAAVIMVIAFLAVPALQRSKRNVQRKNDAGHLAIAIRAFLNDNNGDLPDNPTPGLNNNEPCEGVYLDTKCAFAKDVNFSYFQPTDVQFLYIATDPHVPPPPWYAGHSDTESIGVANAAECNPEHTGVYFINNPSSGDIERKVVVLIKIETGSADSTICYDV